MRLNRVRIAGARVRCFKSAKMAKAKCMPKASASTRACDCVMALFITNKDVRSSMLRPIISCPLPNNVDLRVDEMENCLSAIAIGNKRRKTHKTEV